MPASKDFIDICQDNVFKAVFTKPTPQSRAAITSLLSAFVEQEVSVLTIETNEPPADDTRQRQIRFDISAKFNSGELADIELTLNPKSGENLRMEYYAARLFASQDIRGLGRGFRDLKPAWQISFLAGRPVFRDAAWFHRFIYYDPERGISLGGQTAIIGVELNKLGEAAKKGVEEMSRQERWAVYFGYYRDREKQGLLREIEEKEEGIRMAKTVVKGFTQGELEALREISLHRRQMDYQEEMLARERRLARALAKRRREGLAQGREEGRAQGREEGRAQGREEGQKQLFELLESGKSLEEAKHILGFTP
jgi:predicted transposase/invertase (TIGR01784 family)